MQFVPATSGFNTHIALCCNAPEKHSDYAISKQSRYKTENSHTPAQTIGLDNKPYTLLRTAGCQRVRFFHQLCKQLNQTVETIHGNQDNSLKHFFHLTTPIATPTVPQQSIPFRTNSQPSKSNWLITMPSLIHLWE